MFIVLTSRCCAVKFLLHIGMAQLLTSRCCAVNFLLHIGMPQFPTLSLLQQCYTYATQLLVRYILDFNVVPHSPSMYCSSTTK